MPTHNHKQLLGIRDAAAYLAALLGLSSALSSTTIWRWMRYGVNAGKGNRIHLGHIRVGGRIYTSVSQVTAFCSEMSHAGDRDTARSPAA